MTKGDWHWSSPKRIESLRKWHQKNKDKARIWKREAHRRWLKKHPNTKKVWEKLNPEKRKKILQNYIKNHPEKYQTKKKFNYAVRSGRIKKMPCVICGKKKAQGHHPNYSEPLKVIWLCDKHHKEEHLKIKYADSTNRH